MNQELRIKNKELIIIAILIIATLLFIQLQYLVGSINTPPDYLFLGTVHWPADYLYYLSQMVQGKNNFLYSTMLYTGEKLEPVLVGWQHVLWGRITSFLGIGPIIAYQLAVLFALLAFLSFVYLLIRKIFPDSSKRRILAFFFFVSSTSMPIFRKSFFDFSSWYYHNYWYNTGNIIARLGPIPHHLLAGALASLSLYLVISYWEKNKSWQKKKIFLVVLLFFLGLLLASISPILWFLLIVSSSLAFFLRLLLRFFSLLLVAREGKRLTVSSSFLKGLLPIFFLFLGGIPSSLYVKSVFSIEPYSYSPWWEGWQQIPTKLQWFLLWNGPILIFALLGLPFILRKPTLPKLLAVSFITICTVVFFSGLARSLHFTNARFWPPLIYVFIASLASEGVLTISEFFKKGGKYVFTLVIFVYLICILPSHFAQQREVLKPKLGNSYYYLPKKAVEIFTMVKDLPSKDSLFLVQWPLNESFPSLTGRKSFFGFQLLTIKAEEKNKEIFDFFDGKRSQDESRQFFSNYKIDYLIAYSYIEHIKKLPFLEKIYNNDYLTVYKYVNG